MEHDVCRGDAKGHTTNQECAGIRREGHSLNIKTFVNANNCTGMLLYYIAEFDSLPAHLLFSGLERWRGVGGKCNGDVHLDVMVQTPTCNQSCLIIDIAHLFQYILKTLKVVWNHDRGSVHQYTPSGSIHNAVYTFRKDGFKVFSHLDILLNSKYSLQWHLVKVDFFRLNKKCSEEVPLSVHA